MPKPRTNQKYPNFPEEFRTLVRETRIKKGISMAEMGRDLGFSYAAMVAQLEKGERNFNYERAVQFRDYLGLDYDLPEPRPEEAEPITRSRKKPKPIEAEEFYICVDGELIEVVAYRRLGPMTDASRVVGVK